MRTFHSAANRTVSHYGDRARAFFVFGIVAVFRYYRMNAFRNNFRANAVLPCVRRWQRSAVDECDAGASSRRVEKRGKNGNSSLLSHLVNK